MIFLKKINSDWALRLGLGLMYIYSGVDFFRNPQHWYGFIPGWFSRAIAGIMSVDTYLKFQGSIEVIVGLLLLAWFLGAWAVRLGAVITALEMAFILLFVGLDPITFRDIGLLGAAVALAVRSFQKNADGTI